VGDSEALAASLRPLAEREHRLRLGENARRTIVERGLTWENTAEMYMRQFEQLLVGRVA
jgi:glycosyltransferase involved in cell wall biosynthesis